MGTLPVSARIAAVSSRQHGLVTAAQLEHVGLTRKQIVGWAASGRLDRVLPGVFRVGGSPQSREQALAGAVLWGGPYALASHRSAGESWDYDGISSPRPEISVPVSVKKRSPLVVVHQTRSVVVRRMRHGIPTTTPERTLVDLAGVLGAAQLEIAFESARRQRLVTTASVGRVLTEVGARGRAGCGGLTDLLAALAAEPPCESVLEVHTARMLRASDLPRPECQVDVTAPNATYRLDFAWPDRLVALECDGRKWHEIERDFERDRRRGRGVARTAIRRPACPRDRHDPAIAASGGRPNDRWTPDVRWAEGSRCRSTSPRL